MESKNIPENPSKNIYKLVTYFELTVDFPDKFGQKFDKL